MQLSVHRVIYGRGIDPGTTVVGEGGVPFLVQKIERFKQDDDPNGEDVVKLRGVYENAPSRRATIDTYPEAEFHIAPTDEQLQAIWDFLVDAVERAVEDWQAAEDAADEAPWRTFKDDTAQGIEIDVSGRRFMVRLIDQTPQVDEPPAE